MSEDVVEATLDDARRLFVSRQHLSGGPGLGSFDDSLTEVIRDTGYIQWDPVTIVAPSHLISIWSRIGKFEHEELEKYIFDRKTGFLHWIPTAWIVLMEDYPLFYSLMKMYPESLGNSWRSHIAPARKFLDSHLNLRNKVLERLKEGPAGLDSFKDLGKRARSADGWGSGNEVSTLLFHLNMAGEVMVSGHNGNQNVWSRTEDFLPAHVETNIIPQKELEKKTALRALNALGIANELEINKYFIRGRYYKLKEVLEELVRDSLILKVKISDEKRSRTQYIKREDAALISTDGTEQNLKLIAPFDNILSVRERTRRLFNFDYTLEQFLPKEKRRYGTYVMPVLWDNRLVGRIDVKLLKERRELRIISAHSENGFREDIEVPMALAETVADFADFLGATSVTYGDVKPERWKRYLH